MYYMKTLKLFGIIGLLALTGCTFNQPDQTSVELVLPKDGILSRDSGGLTAAGTISPDTETIVEMVMLEVSGEGMETITKHVDACESGCHDGQAPTGVSDSVTIAIPQGENRLIQALVVGMQMDSTTYEPTGKFKVYYGEVEANVAGVSLSVTIDLNIDSEGASRPIAFGGRYLRADGSAPTGNLQWRYQPKSGSRSMLIDEFPIVAGWFDAELVPGITSTYVVEHSGEVLFNKVKAADIVGSFVTTDTHRILVKAPEEVYREDNYDCYDCGNYTDTSQTGTTTDTAATDATNTTSNMYRTEMDDVLLGYWGPGSRSGSQNVCYPDSGPIYSASDSDILYDSNSNILEFTGTAAADTTKMRRVKGGLLASSNTTICGSDAFSTLGQSNYSDGLLAFLPPAVSHGGALISSLIYGHLLMSPPTDSSDGPTIIAEEETDTGINLSWNFAAGASSVVKGTEVWLMPMDPATMSEDFYYDDMKSDMCASVAALPDSVLAGSTTTNSMSIEFNAIKDKQGNTLSKEQLDGAMMPIMCSYATIGGVKHYVGMPFFFDDKGGGDCQDGNCGGSGSDSPIYSRMENFYMEDSSSNMRNDDGIGAGDCAWFVPAVYSMDPNVGLSAGDVLFTASSNGSMEFFDNITDCKNPSSTGVSEISVSITPYSQPSVDQNGSTELARGVDFIYFRLSGSAISGSEAEVFLSGSQSDGASVNFGNLNDPDPMSDNRWLID
jgi:hypothetical protein